MIAVVSGTTAARAVFFELYTLCHDKQVAARGYWEESTENRSGDSDPSPYELIVLSILSPTK